MLLTVISGTNSVDSCSINELSTIIGKRNVKINSKLSGIKLLKSDCGIL
jgi:hypothetical protein